MMDTDYYFSCVPGQGTTTTLYGLENSIERLSSSYDKVYIIFQLTDPARDFGITDKDPILYTRSKEKHQMKINMLIKKANRIDIDDFFRLYEQIYATRFTELSEKYPNCQFVVWRNFTRWCGANFESTIKIDDAMIEFYSHFMRDVNNIYEGDRFGETSSYHPSPIGHKVWAEYILQHIEEHNGKD